MTTESETTNWRIELDCEPGPTRPGDLLPEVIEGLGVEKDPDDTLYRFMGNWVWEFQTSPEVYRRAKPIVHKRMLALHTKNRIRWGCIQEDD
jgi:hypothetical protein